MDSVKFWPVNALFTNFLRARSPLALDRIRNIDLGVSYSLPSHLISLLNLIDYIDWDVSTLRVFFDTYVGIFLHMLYLTIKGFFGRTGDEAQSLCQYILSWLLCWPGISLSWVWAISLLDIAEIMRRNYYRVFRFSREGNPFRSILAFFCGFWPK